MTHAANPDMRPRTVAPVRATCAIRLRMTTPDCEAGAETETDEPGGTSVQLTGLACLLRRGDRPDGQKTVGLRRRFLRAAAVASLSTVALTAAAAPSIADDQTASQLAASLVVAGESTAGYDRALFEHWVDEDGDGCDTRQEVLIAESQVDPVIGEGCAVISGRWFSWYDGQTWTDPADVDIDHVVALAEAWQSGAHAWTAVQRRAFANDMVIGASLEAVTDDVNAGKGASDPAEWLPSVATARCDYAIYWVSVKYRWNLAVDADEKQTLDDLLAGDCGARIVPTPPNAGTAQPSDDRLSPNETLQPGQHIVSRNGQYLFVMQGDGNAVVYGPSGARWATGTGYLGAAFIAMQGDGNLVVYSASGAAAWASGTGGVSGPQLLMQDDGNLVMYGGDGSPAWVNGQLVQPPATDVLPAGKTLQSDRFLQSRNGAWRLVMQGDGHAVVYGPGRLGWTSGTGWAGPAFLAMQGDGNLVIYTNGGRPVWASGTGGVTSPVLVMQDDGNLVMYSQGNAVWANGRSLAPPPPPPPPPPSGPPPNPGDSKNCSDFATWRAAQDWFEYYYPYYGDVARLDADNDRIACESLPGAP